MTLFEFPGEFAVCRLNTVPVSPSYASGIWSLSITEDEISLVCELFQAPDGAKIEAGWTCFRIAGSIPFAATGVVSGLTSPLADAGIGVFIVSTFDTDYLLVKCESVEAAKNVWVEAGINVVRRPTEFDIPKMI